MIDPRNELFDDKISCAVEIEGRVTPVLGIGLSYIKDYAIFHLKCNMGTKFWLMK